ECRAVRPRQAIAHRVHAGGHRPGGKGDRLPMTLWAHGLALLVLGAATEVVVRDGDTLPKLAKRELGDEKTAGELRALNALSSDELTPGTVLRLPGPGRALALSALVAARAAVQQARTNRGGHLEGASRLKQAEELFQSAKYPEAARAADDA